MPAAPVAAPVVPAAPAPVAPNGAAPKAAAEEEFLDIGLVDGKPERIAKSKALERLRKESSADRRLQEAAEHRKQVAAERTKLEAERQADIQLAKENRAEFFKKYGIDEDEHAKSVLERKLKEAELSPEQRRIAELEANDKKYKEAEGKRAKEAEEAKTTALAGQMQQLMIQDLAAAAGRAGWEINDANRPWALERLAETIGEAQQLGLNPTQPGWPDRIVEMTKVKEDMAFASLEKRVLGGLTGEALAKRLGPKVVKALMDHSVAQLRGKRGFGPPAVAATIAPTKPAANPYISPREFDAITRAERQKIK